MEHVHDFKGWITVFLLNICLILRSGFGVNKYSFLRFEVQKIFRKGEYSYLLCLIKAFRLGELWVRSNQESLTKTVFHEAIRSNNDNSLGSSLWRIPCPTLMLHWLLACCFLPCQQVFSFSRLPHSWRSRKGRKAP